MATSIGSSRKYVRSVGLPVLLAAAALLAGCGDAAPLGAKTEPLTATAPALPPSHGGRGTLPPLDQVPQKAEGRPDAVGQRVAVDWFDLVRRGDDEAAAALMADGARFVNGTIVTLRNGRQRLAATRSLPCGARPVAVGGAAGGYVLLELRLTTKAGAGPCDGEGAPVTVAVHVRDGRIDDWVRVDQAAGTALGPEV